MKNQKSFPKLNHRVIRLVKVVLMNNTFAIISELNKISRSRKVSSSDRTMLKSLIARNFKELVLTLRMIGFFNDNSEKSIFNKKGKSK